MGVLEHLVEQMLVQANKFVTTRVCLCVGVPKQLSHSLTVHHFLLEYFIFAAVTNLSPDRDSDITLVGTVWVEFVSTSIDSFPHQS